MMVLEADLASFAPGASPPLSRSASRPRARCSPSPALGVDVRSHSDAALCILCREPLTKYTGRRDNDFTVQG